MRTLWKSLFSLVLIMLAYSCAKDNDYLVEKSFANQEREIKTRSETFKNMTQFSDVITDKVVTIDFVPVILSGYLDNKDFKDIHDYSIETISREGRNLMYVVNFDEGGWAIVSGRFDEKNLVLAYGTKGHFSTDSIDSPELLFWLDMNKSRVEQEMIKDQKNQNKIISKSLRSSPYDNEPYVWFRIPVGIQTTTTQIANVNPLVETEWGQHSPWDYKTPLDNGNKCPLGCFPVAAAQVIRYLSSYIGHPAGSYRQIDTCFVWDPNNHWFISNVTRSNYSNGWNVMAVNNPGFQSAITNSVGDFIIDVGDRFRAEYSATKTSVVVGNYWYFSAYELACSYKSYNESADVNTVVSNLDNSLPVIITGWDSANRSDTNGDGHSWVIDGYKKKRHLTDYQRYLRIIPTDSLDFYSNLNYDRIYTNAEKELYYPGVDEYEIIHDYTSDYIETLFHMNWGYDGSYNDYFSIYPYTWEPENTTFQYRLKLHYNFSALE